MSSLYWITRLFHNLFSLSLLLLCYVLTFFKHGHLCSRAIADLELRFFAVPLNIVNKVANLDFTFAVEVHSSACHFV